VVLKLVEAEGIWLYAENRHYNRDVAIYVTHTHSNSKFLHLFLSHMTPSLSNPIKRVNATPDRKTKNESMKLEHR
jgi:hypothetical protein